MTNYSIVKRIYSSPRALELFRGSFWSIVGATFSKGLIFLSWIIVARILGSEGYGQFGIVRSTVLMFTTFAGFSLGITASKHVAEFLNSDKQKTGRILGLTISFGILMGLVVGIVFYLLAPWLASETLNSPQITNELRIGALILFFSSLNGAQMGTLQGFRSFKKIAKINAIQAVVSFPLFIVGALYFGIYGTIWAFAISYVIICLLSSLVIKKESISNGVFINFKQAFRERSLLFSYSLPSFLSGLMVTPVKWYSDSLLIAHSGFSEMGIFTAALTLNNIIIVGAGMVSAPFISIMARDKEANRNSNFSRFNILAPWAIGIFLAGPFLLFPEFGGAVFGESFIGRTFDITFSIIMFYTIIIMFKQGLARVMLIYNLQWWSFFSNLLWGIILVACFLLIQNRDSSNLAFSYLIAYIISTIVIFPIYYKRKIIPSNTIESIEAFGIWLLTIFMALLGYYLDSMYFRLVLLLIFMMSFFFLFKRCFEKTLDNE